MSVLGGSSSLGALTVKASRLLVQFRGDRHEVATSQEFSFGRCGDLSLDDNPHLHRVIGVFFGRSSFWWLTNVGAHLPLHLKGEVGNSTLTLAPGSSVPLVLGDTTIRFAAGSVYEISAQFESHNENRDPQRATPFRVDELLLLVALSEPLLRMGPGAELPTHAELIGRFGWSEARLASKLEDLYAHFRDVNYVLPTPSSLSAHAVRIGLITLDQLSLLPPRSPGPL